MPKPYKLSLLIIDAVGVSVVAACVLGAVWLTLIQNDDAAAEIRQLQVSLRNGRQDLAHLHTVRDEQNLSLAKSRAELEQRGRLPEQTPIEDYFQTLTTLTAEHHLRVLRQNPLAPRQYPGLLEQRYAYVLAGTMPDLTRFLWAIEKTDFWADISYFKIESRRGRGAEGSVDRSAELTLSLFSAVEIETATDKG